MTGGAVRLVCAIALLTGLTSAGATSPGAAPGAAALRERVRAYRKAHEQEIVRELADLLSRPNVASDRAAIEASGEAVAAVLRRRGIAAELWRVEGSPPVVYGEIRAPGASRTVVLYAHYDGQPVDPAQWAGDPWRPVLRDKPLEQGGKEIPWDGIQGTLDPEWRLYARSSSDDKAPIIGLMAALDAMRAAAVPLSINVKFFFEGEEEAGSPHLSSILGKYSGRLKADLWLLLDGPVHQTRRMQVFFGARGVTDLELTTYGSTRRLHSGHYGNWSPNPIAELVQLLAGMRDDRGRVLIPGFDADVRPLTAQEQAALAKVPPVEKELREELALGRVEGAPETLVQAIQRPALNLRGISGGDVGARATNSIPTQATASIDFRLVPDQTPASVRDRVEDHLRARGYKLVSEEPDRATRLSSERIVRLRWGTGYPAARTSMDLPASRAVVEVLDEWAEAPVIRLPSLGGSIPMYLFAGKLATPVIGVPTVNHDNNQHAANENLRLQNLWDGIEIYAALMARLGEIWK